MKELVEREPKLSWAEISQSFPRHHRSSLEKRYKFYIKPESGPEPHRAPRYTFEEDQLLIKLKEKGLTWEEITEAFAKDFPRRTGPALEKRYWRVMGSTRQGSRPFTPEEDQCLEELKSQGLEWEKIIEHFPGRTMQGLVRRWSTHGRMKANVKPGSPRYTPEEDQLLRRLKGQGTLTWAEIAESFERRNVRSLTNRWYQLKQE